jgi:cyclohexadieny/prephenate dehydrogenase
VTAAPFERLLVVGAGLLGTSVALAAKRRWPAVHVTAMDAVARTHAPFDVHLDAEAPLPAFDLAVLAVPIARMPPGCAARGPRAAVTDGAA